MFEELYDMSTAITSHSLDSGMQWPFVTLPHFDMRAHRNHRSKVDMMGFAPFVTPAQKEAWERYSVEYQGWLAQDYLYRIANGKNVTLAEAAKEEQLPTMIPEQIHYNDSYTPEDYDDDRFDYEIPLWQVSPPLKNASIINLDLSSVPIFGHLLWDVKVKKVEQYSRIIDWGFLLGDAYYGKEKEDRRHHPRGSIYQPVFEDFHEDADVVGFTMGTLAWDYMFEKVLFDSSVPLLVEIEGTCNAIFTYLVKGDTIEFLGYGREGEWRDPSFDKYKQSADLLEPKAAREGYPPVQHTHRPTDASHGESHCTYVMNTYPTKEFYEKYKTNDPIYYTLVIAGVFCFTAVVFFVYDWLVQVRQRRLMSTAIRTGAIVSSMFPKDFQQRIMDEVADKLHKNKEGGSNKNWTPGDNMTSLLEENNSSKSSITGKPIADLYPDATVFFGDIVQFTKWR
jgi:hypothetical protein